MVNWSAYRNVNKWQIGLITFAVLGSFASGLSSLVLHSTYSPLFVGAFLLITMFFLVCLRKPIWALYAALLWVLLPLGIVPPQFQSPLNRLITFAALGFWVVYALANHKRIIWNVALSLMTAFILWSAITLLWTTNVDRSSTILQAYVLRLILFLFIVPNFIRSMRDLDGLMNILAISGWVLVIYSLFNLFTRGFTPGIRFLVGNINTNAAGSALVVTMIGALWRAAQPTNKSAILVSWISRSFLLLACALIAIGASRGSAISFSIAMFLFLFWKSTRPWGIFGLGIIFCAGIIAPFLFTTLMSRFLLSEGGTLLGGREGLWQASWQLIWDHPWSGVGLGESEFAILPYIRNVDFFISTIGIISAPIHNPVLLIWAETGIPGLILYLGVLGSALTTFIRQYLGSGTLQKKEFAAYFALVTSVSVGYFFSWIKGGGSERDHLYFFLLSLMLLPTNFTGEMIPEADVTETQAHMIH